MGRSLRGGETISIFHFWNVWRHEECGEAGPSRRSSLHAFLLFRPVKVPCESTEAHASLTSFAPRWRGQLDETGHGSLQPCNNETQPAQIASGKSVTVTAMGVIEEVIAHYRDICQHYLFYLKNTSIAVKNLFYPTTLLAINIVLPLSIIFLCAPV